MPELKIVGVDGHRLNAVDDAGTSFVIEVDESSLRQLRTQAKSSDESVKVSPREIQSHIRAGLSAEDVVALTGASLDTVKRYEGPVLAEREFIVNSALAVNTVAEIADTSEVALPFGEVIQARLLTLGGSDQRWASWKESDRAWIVKLEFTANGIEHDARWTFDPRNHTLSAINTDASSLSQKQDLSSGLIPKLRAVSTGAIATHPVTGDTSSPERLPSVAFADEVIEESIEPGASSQSPTADLLDALRKRRSESEGAPAWLRDELSGSTGSENALSADELNDSNTLDIDATITFTEPFESAQEPAPAAATKPTGRKGRTSMPSWDDIVFGTRSDDDPV